MKKRILAYDYLKAILIVLVVLHHALFAYLESFEVSLDYLHGLFPESNLVSPIIDSVSWIGYDVIVVINDVFFMSAFFLIAGYFSVQALKKYSKKQFFQKRSMRLGIPFIFGVLVLSPLTFYVAHLQGGGSLSFTSFYGKFAIAGFFATGHLWFLWLLLLFSLLLIMFYDILKSKIERMMIFEDQFKTFAFLVVASTFVYVPLDHFFGSIATTGIGPFQFQPSRILHYLLFFLVGGILSLKKHSYLHDIELLRKSWHLFAIIGFISFPFWFPLASTSLVFASMGISHTLSRNRFLDSLAKNAFGIYLFHYAISAWLQYLLLEVVLSGLVKGVLVFVLVLGLSWMMSILLRKISVVRRIL